MRNDISRRDMGRAALCESLVIIIERPPGLKQLIGSVLVDFGVDINQGVPEGVMNFNTP